MEIVGDLDFNSREICGAVCCKVYRYYLATILNQTPIFDWCVVRSGLKYDYHKSTCDWTISLNCGPFLCKYLYQPHEVVPQRGHLKWVHESLRCLPSSKNFHSPLYISSTK